MTVEPKNPLHEMKILLLQMLVDIYKSEKNDTARQRIRVNSIKFEKQAKIYRKTSVKKDA